MKKSAKKRIMAIFLALTLFLTSGFFIMFKDEVFGAKNKNDSSVHYVDETTVTNVNASFINEGSNIYDPYTTEADYKALPSIERGTECDGWDAEVDTGKDDKDGNPIMRTIHIPSNKGMKGTKDNPFTAVEIVPDTAMQELTYYVGDEEGSGLPVDMGEVSATVMSELREKTNDSNLRFVNNNYLGKDSSKSSVPGTNLLETIRGFNYGGWAFNSQYNIYQVLNEESGNYEQTKISESPRLFDCTYNPEFSDDQGDYNFNEVYNIDITTDDLMLIDPMEKVEYKDESGNDKVRYTDNYSKYLIALAQYQSGADDAEKVENLKTKVLSKVEFDYRYLQSTNQPEYKNRHITGIVKYDITFGFMQGNKVYAADIKDLVDTESYDVAEGRLARSAKGGGPNLWRVQFKKYYVDHFERLYDAFWKLEKEHDMTTDALKESDLNGIDPIKATGGDGKPDRDQILKRILTEYAPLFEDRGANLKAVYDYLDWESSGKNNIVSKTRVYQAEPQGGYVLAVKPGMGEMYLITDEGELVEIGGIEYYNSDGNKIEFYAKSDKKNRKKIVNPANKAYYGEETVAYKVVVYDEDGDVIQSPTGAQKRVDDSKTKKAFVFARDKKAPTVVKGEVTEKGDDAMRWIYVPTTFALNGEYGNSNAKTYQAGYLDDARYTNGFASKSISTVNDMWFGIYDRNNRKFHGNWNQNTGIDTFSQKMLWKTDANDWPADDSNKLYKSYDHIGNGPWDYCHLNVMKQIFGEDATGNVDSKTIDDNDKIGGIIDTEDATVRGDEITNILRFGTMIDKEGRNFFTNAYDGDVTGLGKDWLFKEYHDVRIADSKYITGLCFNLYDLRVKGWDELGNDLIGSNPDIYNLDQVLNENGYTYHSYLYEKDTPYMKYMTDHGYYDFYNKVHVEHKIPAMSEPNRTTLANRYDAGDSDEAVLVDKDQLVTEKVKKYHFTYYGFGATPILQRSLFNFNTEEQLENFNFKVISLTPAEMNQVAAQAKAQGRRLDLVERGDMFYIHTQLTKSQFSTWGGQGLEMYYKFYNAFVDKEHPIKTETDFKNLYSFHDNDLEWEQVMKLINRCAQEDDSGDAFGNTIPILFNMMVGFTAEEGVDPDCTNYGQGSDTHMYLFEGQTGGGRNWNGNMCNIGKLYTIMLQFDLYAHSRERTTTSGRIAKDEIFWLEESTDETTGKTETTKKPFSPPRYVIRSFMDDIFNTNSIKQVKISDDYKASKDTNGNPRSRARNTAQYTGYVNGYSGYKDGYKENPPTGIYARRFCQDSCADQFKENTCYLWNHFTFYPWDDLTKYRTNKLNETLLAFYPNYATKGVDLDIQNPGTGEVGSEVRYTEFGYQSSYWKGGGAFSDDASKLHERFGSDGTDGQNVAVLRWKEDTTDIDKLTFFSTLSGGSDTGGSAQVNRLLDITYRIMHNRGRAARVQIHAEPRKSTYTLLAADEPDVLLYDYIKDEYNTLKETVKNGLPDDASEEQRKSYEEMEARLGEIESEASEKDIDILAYAHNQKNKLAVITSVYLQKGDSTAEEDRIEITDKLRKKDASADDPDECYSAEGNCATVGEPNTKGIVIGTNVRLDFYIPYTLKQFYQGYNKVVFYGHRWALVQSTGEYKKRSIEHTIDINDYDMFNLQ